MIHSITKDKLVPDLELKNDHSRLRLLVRIQMSSILFGDTMVPIIE